MSSGEDTEMVIMESGAADYEMGEEGFVVYCPREDLRNVRDALQASGVQISDAQLEYTPNNEIEITDFDQALKVIKLLQDLDADEDVEKLWTNAVIDDILRSKVDEFIESRTFHT